MAWDIRNKQLQKANERINKELEEHCKSVKVRLNKPNLAPKDFPKADCENWEKIYNKLNFDAFYPFRVQNVKDFAKFCEECEGFTIG